MDKKKVKKIILFGSILVLFFIILSVLVSFYAIYTSVKNICILAKHDFGRDCVSSLVLLIKSDDYPQKDKNHAIWALGQLADASAIPYLEEFQKIYNCVDPSKKSKVCYELYKAHKWCTEGNVTSWMYAGKEEW